MTVEELLNNLGSVPANREVCIRFHFPKEEILRINSANFILEWRPEFNEMIYVLEVDDFSRLKEKNR